MEKFRVRIIERKIYIEKYARGVSYGKTQEKQSMSIKNRDRLCAVCSMLAILISPRSRSEKVTNYTKHPTEI